MELETDQAVWVRLGNGEDRPATFLGPGEPDDAVIVQMEGDRSRSVDVARVRYEDGTTDSVLRSRLTPRD